MLSFSPQASESVLRSAVLECGRICYERRLLTSNDGNISVRMGNDCILITPSGLAKGRLNEADLIVLDSKGNVIDTGMDRKPSSETPMHLEVYEHRRDVRAVIHAHPVFATALSVAGIDFPADVLPEVRLTLGDVPTTAYATPASHEDALVIRPFIKDHDALLLRQHGSLTVGRDLEQALIHLERLEHVAEVFWRAQMLGTVNRIPREMQARLIEMREKYFHI